MIEKGKSRYKLKTAHRYAEALGFKSVYLIDSLIPKNFKIMIFVSEESSYFSHNPSIIRPKVVFFS